jgi:hypothetical protein
MLDGIITRAQAEASSDSSSSDDDDDDDTNYLKEIYGYGGSLIPSSSAAAAAAISVSAISKQHSKTGGASVAEQQKITINHANEFERRAREITIASKMKSSTSSSSSSNNNSRINTITTATRNNNDKKTQNTKSSSSNEKKAADNRINNGAIMDYAWDDNDKKKTVSIYITLPGLDNVLDDDISISLINDNRGIYFTVKNIIATTVGASTGGSTNNKNTSPTAITTRFLKIDKLYSKVTNVKLIRKIGQNKVIIKLTKDTTTTTSSSTTATAPTTSTTKWYTLQEGGSHTIIGHDWYDDDSDDDDWTPQEDEAAVNDFLNNL